VLSECGLACRNFMNLRNKKRKILKRIQYIVMRNVVPINEAERIALNNSPRVLVNSIPKSGTHLLREVLNQLPGIIPRWTYHVDHQIEGYRKQFQYGRCGQVLTAHMSWEPGLLSLLNNKNYRIILMVRDLRDIAVSSAFYGGYKDKSHRLYNYLSSLSSDDERLMAQIKGIDGHFLSDGVRSKSWGEHASEFLPWLNEDNCLLVRFEDLIGEDGGGDWLTQMKAIESVTRHLGFTLTEEEINKIANNAFKAKARTFRKGQIGDWKNHFKDEHVKAFKETAGQALIEMGYEQNFDW